MGFFGIQLSSILYEVLKLSTPEIDLKITLLKLQSQFPVS